MTNRLSAETSPYLLQHADNPVDWHPWGAEALALAKTQDKPILLSVGYSACHWCHVMAHESFENAATAAVMNEHFINIKVDREERPDIDQIYQTAHAMMVRRSGGWPLTMFLTPDQVPFYGGTYFPPTPRYNLPGFADLLHKIAAAYREHKADIELQSQPLMESLAQRGARKEAQMADESVIRAGVEHLAQAFDAARGGFGGAPKFPNEPDWALLLRIAASGDETARNMVSLTLDGMARGGIYDHLGGGFCRYSVDERWEIPHFEKMLYDNGQLLSIYTDGWLLTGEPRWREVVEETVGWMLREMGAPEGGFYSSLDADSEGAEGKFYAWSREEARNLLTAQEYALAAAYYGLEQAPNFEHGWHLKAEDSLAAVAGRLGIPPATASALLASVRAKLLAARDARVRPGLDDKLLTSWNALAIKGLARAGRAFEQPAWIAAAQRATDFIRDTLWVDGRLLATCKEGKAHLNAYLDDHAFLLDALLELLQAEHRRQDLLFAIDIAEALLARFEDTQSGGFFFTSHDHESLIQRPKAPHDNA
ncbi:MAG TPA: thioredoxin domain-containing protein, partial [Novimethylophilus sp.]|uniref:thioredoxin domain-containing protein n=1 Tax=Novimethylophilus sp. TaxID=2137426 RepID=UPI002F3E205B